MVKLVSGNKYLEVSEIDKIQKRIEDILKEYGLNIKTKFHPQYTEVPNYEEVTK